MCQSLMQKLGVVESVPDLCLYDISVHQSHIALARLFAGSVKVDARTDVPDQLDPGRVNRGQHDL